MKKLGVALLSVLAVNSAFATDWIKVTYSKDGSLTSYLDFDNVRQLHHGEYEKGRFIEYVIKVELAKTQYIHNNPYDYVIALWKGNCKKYNYLLTDYKFYKKNGDIVEQGNDDKKIWHYTLPNSTGRFELTSACLAGGYPTNP